MAYLKRHLAILSVLLTVIAMPVAGQTESIATIEEQLKGNLTDSARLRLLINLSEEYTHIDHSKAIRYAEDAAQQAEKSNVYWATIDAYKQLSSLAALSGDFTTALKYDLTNLENAIAKKDSSAMAQLLTFVGDDHLDLGHLDEAYHYFTQAFRIGDAINDSLRLVVTLHNVGTVFKQLGQYDIALQHFESARKIGEKIHDEDGLAYLYDEKADLYLRKKDYKMAKEMISQARKAITDRKLSVIEHLTYTKEAMLAFELGEYDRALAFYDTASILQRKRDNEYGMAEIELGKATVYLAQKKFKEAEELLNRTLSASKDLHARNIESESYRLLSELAESKGDFKLALGFQKQYKSAKDSSFSQDMMQRLFQNQLRFETEAKDSEIANLSRMRAVQEENLQRQELLRNILIVVASLAIILLFTMYRSGQRRIKINKLLLEHQAEVKKRSVELEQLNQVKDKFFSIISHDLRSPMNALAGILDLAEKKKLSPEEFTQLTKELRVQFNHTKTLINNLLDWTLLQMDKLKIQEDKIDLANMVDQNFKLFDATQSKQTQMKNLIQPGTFVKADTNMVNLVFRNLILNAIKFTEMGGQVTVSSKAVDNMVQISISDNGVGITPEVQAILFEKTTGYSTRGTANEKGTGLGLILCKEFVEKNGGQIWLESEVGKGSTFHFTLPKA